MNGIVHADIFGHFEWLLRRAVPTITCQNITCARVRAYFYPNC